MRGQRAAHLDAAAGGDMLPGVTLIIDGRRAGAARARPGGAVILALERDAIAFFLRAFGCDRGAANRAARGHGEDGRSGERQFECIGHNISLRSEEHTSELQSLMRISYAVFCLKKKKTQTITKH